MKRHVDAPKGQQGPEGKVGTLSPMGFQKDNDVVTPSKAQNPALLEPQTIKIGVNGMKKAIHVPRNHPDAP
jgi:hypothetical protein